MGELSDNSSMEGDLKFYGDNGILVDKAEEHVDKNVELHSHMSDSPTKIEASGSRINLFVEVFGPLDEIDEGYDDLNGRMEHVIPGSRESDQKYGCEVNGTMSNDVKVASFKSEEECAFNVSDLVWAKARTQTWWPGTICDPFSDAAKDATKSEKKGPFLVKYFGNPYFTWCSNSDLRPFAEYFEQMSRQNDSRNFLGSVDKAIGEIGRRVKSKMTCHCFLKESHTLPAHIYSEDTEKSPSRMDNASKFDDLYLSQFKPASFCSYIRNLASGFSVPNKIELLMVKTRLSAFYCSIGHYQLPMQLLRPSSDTPQNTQDNLTLKAIDEGQNTSGSVEGFEKSAKSGYDDSIATGRKRRKNHGDGKLRERKKSKYLSYPYIDGEQNGEISSTVGRNIRDDPKNLSCGSAQSNPTSNLTGKDSQNKGSRNSFKGRYIVSKADNIDAASAQLLTELHSFARDCFYPARSKYSDSLKRFYCSFRTFAFLDFEMAHGILKSQKVPTGAMAKVQKKGKGKEKVKESGKNQGINSGSVTDNASNEEPEKDIQQEKGSSRRVKAKKKEEILLSAGMEPAGDLLNIRDTTSVNNSCMIALQLQGSDIPKKKTPKKRKKGEASPTHLQLETHGSDILKNKTPEKRKKGEASPMDLQSETQGSDIPKNKTPEKKKKGEASPTHLQLEMQGSDILKSRTPEKTKEGEASPMDLQLEMQGFDIPKNKTPEKKKKGEASPTHLQLEMQGSDIPKSRTPEKTKKGEASPMDLQLEMQGSDIPKNKTPEKKKKGEASPTHLQLEMQGSDIPKSRTPEKTKKGEASPMDLQLEMQGSDIPKNKTPEKKKKGDASPTHLQLEMQGSDIPKSRTPEKTKKGEAIPMDLQLEMQGSDIPKNKTPEKRKKGEASPMHLQLETQGSDIQETRTPEKREKGEASPTHLQFETQSSAILENKTPEKTKKGEESPTHLLLEMQGSDISKNKTPEKGKKGEASPTHLQFETQSSDIPKSKPPEKKRNGEASPTHLQFETTARLPDLNGNISSIAFENLPLGVSAMHQHTQNINGTDRSLISGYAATESTSILLHNAKDSSFHNSLQKILLPSNGKPERKKWKRKKETSQVVSVIPDLNGTTADSPSLEKISPAEDHTSPDGDHPQKKRRISRPNEDLGAMLLLNFALEHPLPSKETLVATFSRFGLLKESETQFLDDSSVQIFYERTTDAQFAIRRLEKNNPFGESLISFKFHSLALALASTMETKETTTPKAASSVGKNHKKHLPQPFSPADTVKVPSSQKGDTPNLPFIKKNVEMMKMTLEKAGDNISPEMRAKLENEIKSFLDKIASLESTSSP